MPDSAKNKLLSCKRCPRFQRQFKQLRKSHPDYWNKPVLPTGGVENNLLIVGLAPGMHGANRTGIPFTGDASGHLLFKVLSELGIEDKVGITNAVKCLPPQNKPTATELDNCRKFLRSEVDQLLMCSAPVIFCLGQLAHRSVIRLLDLKQTQYPFAHGAYHKVDEHLTVIDSYHCSRYNTQTRRLTEKMFRQAVSLAAKQAKLI